MFGGFHCIYCESCSANAKICRVNSNFFAPFPPELVGQPKNVDAFSDEQQNFDIVWAAVESSMKQLSLDVRRNRRRSEHAQGPQPTEEEAARPATPPIVE